MAHALHPTYLFMLLSLKLSRDSLVPFLLQMFIMLQSALDLFLQALDLFSDCLTPTTSEYSFPFGEWDTHDSVLLSIMRP
jgi:hypothetical protein